MNPTVLTRMRTGWAVIGDTQHLPGYCLLLHAERGIDHLTDLLRAQRVDFLFDLSLLGEAVQAAAPRSTLRSFSTTRCSATRCPSFTAMSTPGTGGNPSHTATVPSGGTPIAPAISTASTAVTTGCAPRSPLSFSA